jgi:hypothetical protein
MHHQLKSIPINRSHSSQSNVILAHLTISCLRVPRCETWRAVKMEDGSWIVAAYKDGWIQLSGPPRPYDEMAQSA